MLKGRKSAARNPNFAGERKIKNQLAGIVPPKSPEKLWWKKQKIPEPLRAREFF